MIPMQTLASLLRATIATASFLPNAKAAEDAVSLHPRWQSESLNSSVPDDDQPNATLPNRIADSQLMHLLVQSLLCSQNASAETTHHPWSSHRLQIFRDTPEPVYDSKPHGFDAEPSRKYDGCNGTVHAPCVYMRRTQGPDLLQDVYVQVWYHRDEPGDNYAVGMNLILSFLNGSATSVGFENMDAGATKLPRCWFDNADWPSRGYGGVSLFSTAIRSRY